VNGARAALALFLAVLPASAHAGLVVDTTPNTPEPNVIMTIPTGGIATPLQKQAGSLGSYVGDVPVPANNAWSQSYMLIGYWPDGGRSQIYLRSTLKTINPALILFNAHRPETASELSALAALGQDLNSLLETYQAARAIYRDLPNKNGSLGQRALKISFDAAYMLARDYPYIAPDREMIDVALASNSPYLKKMALDMELLEWRDAGLVSRLVRSGDLTLAQQINTYYSDLFDNLDTEKQARVLALYRINAAWFASNAQQIAARLAVSSKP
jgi:hypothetical protein